mmetsp:Transcript_27344/g.45853  ORF Transcript_27344/g.45853 Transcript_27344/m.45853 type:complete len:396 (+) Transcript_27344:72-1259(+)
MGSAASAKIRRNKNTHEFIGGITMSDAQVEAVKESWGMVKGRSARGVGEIAFIRLFEREPETFDLFTTFNKIENWKSSKQYLHHCATVVKVIGHVVEVLLNPELLDRNMDHMGMRHAMLPITSHHFHILGECFVEGYKTVLGDQFSPLMKESWEIVYTIMAKMIMAHVESYNEYFDDKGWRADGDSEQVSSSPVATTGPSTGTATGSTPSGAVSGLDKQPADQAIKSKFSSGSGTTSVDSLVRVESAAVAAKTAVAHTINTAVMSPLLATISRDDNDNAGNRNARNGDDGIPIDSDKQRQIQRLEFEEVERVQTEVERRSVIGPSSPSSDDQQDHHLNDTTHNKNSPDALEEKGEIAVVSPSSPAFSPSKVVAKTSSLTCCSQEEELGFKNIVIT